MTDSTLPAAVLIIHDERKGHLHPAMAVAEILEQQYALKSIAFRLPITLKKSMISMMKKLSYFPFLFQLFGKLCFKTQPTHPEQYQAIVCSGMPNLIYAAWLARQWNIPLIYAGGTRKFNPGLIDRIICTVPEQHHAEQIIVPTCPVLKKFSNLSAIAPQAQACLLLGGPTREYAFSLEDYQSLIEHFHQFCLQHHFRGKVVMSRRTPNLPDHTGIRFPQIDLIPVDADITIDSIMLNSQFIFVTADSVSMLSEALQTGRSVISVHLPQQAYCFYDDLLKIGYLQSVSLDQLDTVIDLPCPIHRNMMLEPIIYSMNTLFKSGIGRDKRLHRLKAEKRLA